MPACPASPTRSARRPPTSPSSWSRRSDHTARSGAVTAAALSAADSLAAEGLSVGVVHVHTVKPLHPDALLDAIGTPAVVMTAEEHLRAGGLGTAVLEVLSDSGTAMSAVIRLGLDDAFVAGYGTHAEALAAAGLHATGIEQSARQWLAKCGPTGRGATGCRST